MNGEIIVALITSLFTFAGVLVTVIVSNKKTSKQLKDQSDLTIYRIEQLEKKQDKHNTLIERMYNVEEHEKVIDERIKVVDHRISELEHKFN